MAIPAVLLLTSTLNAAAQNAVFFGDPRHAAAQWLARHVPCGSSVGVTFDRQYVPDLSCFDVWAIVPSQTAVMSRYPDRFVLNEAYARRFMTTVSGRAFLTRLCTGALGFDLVFRSEAVAPRWAPLFWERRFSNRVEDPSTVLDKPLHAVEVWQRRGLADAAVPESVLRSGSCGLFPLLGSAVPQPPAVTARQLAVAPPEQSTISQPERSSIAPPTLSIVAPPGLEPAANGLARLDTRKLVTVMQLVGLRDAGPPIVVMLAAEDSAVAQRTPSWVAGFADGDAGTIVIFPARTPPYPYDSMEALLHHEVAHVLISRAAPQADIPRWFHEGLAMALERTWGLRDRSELALAVIGGRRSIAAIDADFGGSATSAARAYGVAGAFVRDLISRHGRDFPARVLAALAAGAPFDAAFSASTTMSLAEAERRFWHESWWYRVVPLITSSFALWLGVVVLAVVANRRRAARRRARHAQWDADDPES